MAATAITTTAPAAASAMTGRLDSRNGRPPRCGPGPPPSGIPSGPYCAPGGNWPWPYWPPPYCPWPYSAGAVLAVLAVLVRPLIPAVLWRAPGGYWPPAGYPPPERRAGGSAPVGACGHGCGGPGCW